MDIDFIIFAGFVLYIFYQIFFTSSKKKPQKKVPGQQVRRPKNVSAPSRQVPQGTQTKTAPKRAKTLEQILEDMYNQSTGQGKTSAPMEPYSPQQIPAPPSRVSPPKTATKEVFSYDDQYEGEKYDKRKKKEIANILQTRQDGKHLTDTLHAYDLSKSGNKAKKKVKKKGFKFNAKDAIIYDIIMNRKYK